MLAELIEAQNFLSFGPEVQHLDLSKPGLFLITGKNDQLESMESNGAGKSSVLEMLAFAIYGRVTKKDMTQERIINEVQKKECMVRYTFWGDDNEHYQIERWIKHGKSNPLFLRKEIDGVFELISSADKADTQRQIEEIVKFTFQSFINTIMMTQEQVDGFLNDNTAQKKEIIENILQLNVITKYGKVASEKRKLLEKEVDRLRMEKTNLEKIIANTKTSLEEYVASCKKKKTDAAEQILLFEGQLAELTAMDVEAERKKIALYVEIQAGIQKITHQIELKKESFTSLEAVSKVTREQQSDLADIIARLKLKLEKDGIAEAKQELDDYIEECTTKQEQYRVEKETKMKRLREIETFDFEVYEKAIEDYEKSVEVFNVKKIEFKELATALQTVNKQVEDIDEQMSDIDTQVAVIKKRAAAVITTDLEEKLQALQDELHHVQSNPDKCPVCNNILSQLDLDKWISDQQSKISDVAKQMQDKLELLSKYALDIQALQDKKVPKQMTLDNLQEEGSRLKSILRELKVVLDAGAPPPCPYTREALLGFRYEGDTLKDQILDLGRDVLDSQKVSLFESNIAAKKAAKAETKAEFEIQYEKVEALQKKRDEQLLQEDEIEKQIKALRDSITLKTSELPVIKTEEELAALDKQKSDFEQKINELKTREFYDKEYMGTIMAQIRAYDDELTKIDYDKMNKKYVMMRWWENALSSKKNSMKSWCIQTIIEYMNDRVKYYVDRFFDGAVGVSFDTELNETIDIYAYDRVYGQFSGGEKRRLNVAILFALNELVKTSLNSSRMNILMLDEVLGNFLDDKGVATILDILQEKQGEDGAGYYVIEHKESFKEYPYFSQININKKVDGFSYIEEEKHETT